MTQTITTQQGRAYVFVVVDHCSGEFIATHASSSASRWEALEPVRQGVTLHFGGVRPDAAKGLNLRHDQRLCQILCVTRFVRPLGSGLRT